MSHISSSKTIRYSQSLEILGEAARRRSLGVERLPLESCLGRHLAEDVRSPEAVPGWDNSAMDGFAVRVAETADASPERPVRLPVLGSVSAGEFVAKATEASRAGAWEIMTGAPVPPGGFDGVVKVEDVEVTRDPAGNPVEIRLTRAVRAGDHVRCRGEDFSVGQPVLPRGEWLGPEAVLALAGLGVSELAVRARPRVTLFSTGKELAHHTARELAPGMIRNNSAPYLLASIPAYDAEARFGGVIADSKPDFLRALERVLRGAGGDGGVPDVVLTTGAVSMGKHDFVREALEEFGAEIHYHKVAIRPGKPALFASLPSPDGTGGKPGPVFFGMPGNPVSSAVGLRFFVSAYLRALGKLPPERPVRARLAHDSRKPEDLRCFFKARLEAGSDGCRVHSLSGQQSFMTSPLLRANAWVIFPEEGDRVAEGTELDVYPLAPAGFDLARNGAGVPDPSITEGGGGGGAGAERCC